MKRIFIISISFIIANYYFLPALSAANVGNKIATPNSVEAERHENIAKIHREMAQCLRSGKSGSECRRSLDNSYGEMGGHCMGWESRKDGRGWHRKMNDPD